MPKLSDKEISLLFQLLEDPQTLSQRELAKKTGLSLGLLNSILHHLIKRGYVKVKNSNKKNMWYLLTPKGVSQVTRRSYQTTVKVVQHYLAIEHKLNFLISSCIQNGHRHFFLHGDGELAKITKRCLSRNFKKEAQIVSNPNASTSTVIFNLTDRPTKWKESVVNLLDHI